MIIVHINRKLLAMLIDLCTPGDNIDPARAAVANNTNCHGV